MISFDSRNDAQTAKVLLSWTTSIGGPDSSESFSAELSSPIKTNRNPHFLNFLRILHAMPRYALTLDTPWAPITKLSMVRHVVVPFLGCGCSRDSSHFWLHRFLCRRSRTPGNSLILCTHILPNHSRTTKVGWTYAIVSGSYRGLAKPEPGPLSDFTQHRMTYRCLFRRMGILSPPSRGIRAPQMSVKRQS